MKDKLIVVSKDYSSFPHGRYKSDGPYSGERFREELLEPAIKSYDKVIVDLSGTIGLGSSFLEEAFGGLVRECGYTTDTLKSKLEIRSALTSYITQVWNYIKDAKKKK